MTSECAKRSFQNTPLSGSDCDWLTLSSQILSAPQPGAVGCHPGWLMGVKDCLEEAEESPRILEDGRF